MANYRLVNTAMWDDDWFSNLDYTERYLFLYFLTNPLTNIAGVYQVSLKRVAFDTGIDQPMLKKLIARFEEDGRVFYEVGWVVMKNWHKHQHLNPNQLTAAINAINGLPLWLRQKLLDPQEKMFLDIESHLKAYVTLGDPLLELKKIGDSGTSESLTKPYATREEKRREAKSNLIPPNPPQKRGGAAGAGGGSKVKDLEKDDATWL